MAFTFEEFKERVSKREYAEKTKQYTTLLDKLEMYMDTNEILSFYPKNLLNSSDTEFFIFTEDVITIVKPHALETQEYVIRSFNRELTELILDLPEYEAHGVKLTLKNGNEELKFNSYEDSNSYWKEVYVENILEVCRLYTRGSSDRKVEA